MNDPKEATDPAIEAMRSSIAGSDKSAASSLKFYIEEFLRSLKVVSPEAKFTSKDIVTWARAYLKNLPEDAPSPPESVLSGGYALGKYLKNNESALGIVNVGSYGNRWVYELSEEEE